MTYQETLEYMYAQLPMFSRVGAAAIKTDITNTVILCREVGNPQDHLRTVHIAGTNGKGSTSHMLASVFQAAGYKTGLYTSPHLKDFRERIRVNGKMIPEAQVVDFIGRMEPVITRILPSFFEITVAMAFEYFVTEKVDIAIIETGLGGRLDSTNIITPDLSVITNIGMDHMNILGDSIEKIAFEKAGIIKPGVPVVIGLRQPVSDKVFEEKALQEHARLIFASDVRFVADWKLEPHLLQVEATNTHTQTKDIYQLDLPGMYQAQNLVTVLEAIALLKQAGWLLKDEHVRLGLLHVKKNTGLHGRWETIHEHPRVVLDVGHNADGIRAIAAQLEVSSYHHLRIVIGMVRDKDIDSVLSLLPATATYYFAQAQIPRALPASELAEKARLAGLQGQHHANVNEALQAALAHADKDDLILICGSVFFVGEVKAYFP